MTLRRGKNTEQTYNDALSTSITTLMRKK